MSSQAAWRVPLLISVLILSATALGWAEITWTAPANPALIWLGSALTVLTLLATVHSFGLLSVPTIFFGFVALPPLVPIATLSILDTPLFNTRALFHQTLAGLTWPIFLSGVFLALTYALVALLPRSMRDGLKAGGRIGGKEQPQRSQFARWPTISVAALSLILAILSNPTFRFIGLHHYQDVHEHQIEALAFVPALWLVAATFVLTRVARSFRTRAGRVVRTHGVELALLAAGTTWFLLHGDRSETIGLIAAAGIIYTNETGAVRKATAWFAIAVAGFFMLGVIRSLELYFGSGRDIEIPSIAGADFVMIGFVSAVEQLRAGDLTYQMGRTIVGHLQRLPPGFLGLERWPTPYALVQANVVARGSSLQGGEYLIIEPVVNFGPLGLLVWAVLVATIIGIIAQLARRRSFEADWVRLSLFGGLFRLGWYGLTPYVKLLVIVFVALGSYRLVAKATPRIRRRVETPPT